MISTLTYLSTLQGSVDRTELERLLEISRAHNAEIGVTGLLLVRDRQVMQILEGDQTEVHNLYVRISRDPRHRHVRKVWSSTSRDRRFPDWSMGFEDLHTGDAATTIAHTSAVLETSASEVRTFLNRRIELLRRGLASGHRLISTLAVIMDAHDPQTVTADDGTRHLQCRQGCRVDPDAGRDRQDEAPRGYPCPTAQNAFWALDATL